MKKTKKPQGFRQQMAGSMDELRAIMASSASPTNNGRLTVRTIEITEPSNYSAREIKKLRESLNLSQAIFARMVGVSDVLVRSWERGAREPAPVARRLLDQIRAHPEQFSMLIRPSELTGAMLSSGALGATSKKAG